MSLRKSLSEFPAFAIHTASKINRLRNLYGSSLRFDFSGEIEKHDLEAGGDCGRPDTWRRGADTERLDPYRLWSLFILLVV